MAVALALLLMAQGPAVLAQDGASQLPATAPTASSERELVIATKNAPPFAFRGPDGRWTGIAVELFAEIADRLHLNYRLQEATLKEMIDGVADRSLDAAVGALTITEQREERVDFTFPYYSTGLGIAVKAQSGSAWMPVLRNFFTRQFLTVVAALAAVLLAAGAAAWIFERRRNSSQFDPRPGRGLGDGFWWAAVTMTTVGYGDKAPITLGGRLVGVVWMFASMIIVASFTAAITASLTVGQINGAVHTVSDLARVRVGVVENSAAIEELGQMQISARPFASIDEGFRALIDGRIDAFVQDQPLMLFAAREAYQGQVEILPIEIGRQDYGFALQQGSGLREPLNRALLDVIRSPGWKELLARYLGRQD